jgi:hypothetical protein
MARPAHLATPLLEVARGLLRRTPTPLRAYLTLTARLGYLPRYRNPRTFNEKLVWLLRNTDDPRRAQLADKLALKAYVARVTPEAKTARVITAAPRGEALDLTNLPERCVLKVNNGYQRNLVLRAPHDSGAIVARANAWLAEDPAAGLFPWETHYRAIPPMVFIEAFLGDPHAPSLTDHKVFVFGGRAKFIRVMSARVEGKMQRIVIDPDWNILPGVREPLPWQSPSWRQTAEPPPKPANLSTLLSISERLAGDLPFVSVDTYLLGDDIYIGELTFSPAGGAIPFPYPFDLQLGEQWALPMRGGR